MFKSNEEILATVIGSTILLLIFGLIVIVAVLKYQQRRRNHVLELQTIRQQYQQEILKAQLEVREQTMNVIAQEIHDNIGQVLALAKLNLNRVINQDQIIAIDKIKASKELVSQAIQDLRNLSKTLNGEFISQTNLASALEYELNAITKAGAYITRLISRGEAYPIDQQKQLILYRIMQEALHNIIRHAHASEVEITIHYLDSCMNISLHDNGIGFKESEIKKGTGLINMEYRAKLIGVTYTIDSKPNEGTTLNFSLPIIN